MGWKGPALGSHDGERLATGLAGLKTLRRFHHLNIAAVAPYDDGAFIERCVGIENLRAHDRRT